MTEGRGSAAAPQLIQAARRRERWAEEEIARTIQSFARHLCRGRGSPTSPEPEWEDVAQEACRRFFASGLAGFRAGGPERGYLYSIVKATRIQIHRSMARRARRETEAVGGLDDRRAPDAESTTLLHRILRRLSSACAELLERAFLDGASYADLAAEMGMAESSVRSKVTRCLQKARELVP